MWLQNWRNSELSEFARRFRSRARTTAPEVDWIKGKQERRDSA